MRKLAPFPVLAALLLCGCDREAPDAAVIVYDDGYTVRIVLDNRDGITSPDGLLWREGSLYIADEGGSAIRVWDGREVVTLADARSGLISPEDLRFDEQGILWFTDDSAGGAWRVDKDGAKRVDGGAIGESEGIARHPSGGVTIGDGLSGTLYHVGLSAPAIALRPLDLRIAKPESMVLAPDGSMIVADNREDRLIRITLDGIAASIALPPDLSPESIALDGDILWLSDSHNGRIYRKRPGQAIETMALFIGDLSNVSGIAAGAGGDIFVSVQADLDNGRGYIVKLSPAGGES